MILYSRASPVIYSSSDAPSLANGAQGPISKLEPLPPQFSYELYIVNNLSFATAVKKFVQKVMYGDLLNNIIPIILFLFMII